MATFAERRHYHHGGRTSQGQAPPPRGYGRGEVDWDVGSGVADNFAVGPGDAGGGAPARVDVDRLRRDHSYLLQAVCGKFQDVDTYHRGMITSVGFAKALKALGLKNGDKEVDDILEYCQVTRDGFVIYKDLLAVLGPRTPRAKQTTANLAIFPHDGLDARSEPSALPSPAGPPSQSSQQPVSQACFASRTDAIRKVYARWERGFLSDRGLEEELAGLGCPPTPEFQRLLNACGPSRSMPFGRMMAALQVTENDGRRARNLYEVRPGESEATGSRAGRRTAWDEPQPGSVASTDLGSRVPRSVGGGHDGEGLQLRELVCGFVDGVLPSVSFRHQLGRLGIRITPELERLVRIHESDNSVGFGEFARLLLRQPDGHLSAAPHRGMLAGSAAAAGGGGLSAFVAGRSEDGASSSAPPSTTGGRRGVHPVSHENRGFRPPYATTDGDPGLLGSANQVPSPSCSSGARSGGGLDMTRRQPSRGGAGRGDIISWHGVEDGTRSRPAVPPRPPQEDFLQWGGAPPVGADYPKNASASRLGKRYFASGPPAAEAAPFGREPDARARSATPGGWRPPSSSAPFGTEADRWIRADQAGTDEYRSVQSVRRPGGRW